MKLGARSKRIDLRRVVSALWLAAAASACKPGVLDAVAVNPNTLTQDLVAHYTFDEGQGTAVLDHSGNKRDGVLTGGTWITDGGAFGGALHFGGTDFVTVDKFPNAAPSFSASLWLRAIDAPLDGYETVLSTEVVFQSGWEVNIIKITPGTVIEPAFWDSPGDAGIDAGADGEAAGDAHDESGAPSGYARTDCTCLAPDTWTHLVVVVDASDQTLTLYVQAVPVATVPALYPILPGTPELLMGRWSGNSRFLVGDLDDVAIYNRALAPAEISELQNHPPPDAP